ncbi:hypothetical protein D3C85_1785630 [compost metagenome]
MLCSQARRSTHSPIGTIMPFSSISGMKLSGITRPWPGRRQRSSTSMACTRRVAMSMMGWKCGSNWPSASALRRLFSSSKCWAADTFIFCVKNW